jgi:hypothetical protein
VEGQEPPLNPAQQAVLGLLGAGRADRPAFDDELRHHLRARIEEGIAPTVALLAADEDVFVTKHALGQVHGCEVRHLAEADAPFAWTPSMARGVVAHKAIELSVAWRGERNPLRLTEEAVARLEEGTDALADWIQGIGEAERAELVGEANDRVAAFLECFPPLKHRWTPRPESRLRAELAGGRVVLAGKADLTLGTADGLVAGKVIIDLKTGGTSPVHAEDLRFYALVETLRLGVPPRRLASYYLDQGRAVPEDVTVAVLEATVERVVAGVEKLVALRHRLREPVYKPGPACRWCVALPECDPGRRHLAERDELEDHDDGFGPDLELG